MCRKCVFKIAGKSNNYQFYLPTFFKFCDNISHKLLRPSQFLEKFGRVPTPKLVSRNCLRYLQTTLIMRGGGLVSEFMWGIVASVDLHFKYWFHNLDLSIRALLNSLVTKCEWFARKSFTFIGACLFKTFKLKNLIFLLSWIFKCMLLVNSLLNFSY